MKILDLYITKVCNLNCEYCYVDLVVTEKQIELDSFFKRIDLLQYDHIKFFGGEPLLRWKEIKKIIFSVKRHKSNTLFTIITNGILLDRKKILFCIENNISIIISIHYKGIEIIFNKLYHTIFAKDIISFNFIFDVKNILFPYKIIYILQNIGYINFIVTPEIYSDWNNKNIYILKKELFKLEKLFINNRNINYGGLLNGKKLKSIIKGCSKDIVGLNGEKYLCNRFNKINKLVKYNYQYIYNEFNNIINYDNDKYKWFYVCPIGWYLDSLDIKKDISLRINQYKELNNAFICFYKNINNIKGKINFLSDDIYEIRFNLTYKCNIRCKYCYVDFKNKTLNKDIAKNIIDFHLSQVGEKKVISFFGGEPMLEFTLLKELVEYSKKIAYKKKKKLYFSIATNFLLVNYKKIMFLKENNFKIHISFNGKKNVNDTMRDNSTILLLKNIKQYSDIIGKYNIVILLAFSNNEVSYLSSNLKYIYNIGFKNINLEMIFGNNYKWNLNNIITLKSELKEIKYFISFNKLNLINLNNKNKILDISVDGEAGENSFEFNRYLVNFKLKGIFDKLIQIIFAKSI